MDICEKPRGLRKRSFRRARLPLSIREYIKACVQLQHRCTLAEAQSRCFKMASLVKPFNHLHCITPRMRNNKMGISVPPTSPSLIVFHLTPSRCVYGGKWLLSSGEEVCEGLEGGEGRCLSPWVPVPIAKAYTPRRVSGALRRPPAHYIAAGSVP